MACQTRFGKAVVHQPTRRPTRRRVAEQLATTDAAPSAERPRPDRQRRRQENSPQPHSWLGEAQTCPTRLGPPAMLRSPAGAGARKYTRRRLRLQCCRPPNADLAPAGASDVCRRVTVGTGIGCAWRTGQSDMIVYHMLEAKRFGDPLATDLPAHTRAFALGIAGTRQGYPIAHGGALPQPAQLGTLSGWRTQETPPRHIRVVSGNLA